MPAPACRFLPSTVVCPPVALLLLVMAAAGADTLEDASGRELMAEVYHRHHQYPYVYEEQTMILIDRDDNRESRRLRRYSRVESDGRVRFLLLFDSPREVKGVALLAERDPAGEVHQSVYLPAYGEVLIESSGEDGAGNFLGTDFSVENLTGEDLEAYRYVRQRDLSLGAYSHYVVDVYPVAADPAQAGPAKRHFIRKDNLFIVRTDYFDALGRIRKQRTQHDLRAVDRLMWRAGMILMQDRAQNHSTLIKIDRRVFSRDYVPASMFTAEWLFKNQPALEPEPEPEDGEDRDGDDSLELEDGQPITAGSGGGS